MNAIIVSIVTLLGGLAFFLYGMNIMSTGLERMAGGKLETILKKASSNKVKGMALGAGVTAVIQSSSATTVMIVGLVGSGIMTLPQTIGMLMGTNIGTTITPWITALPALGGDGNLAWLGYLKPSFFTPIIAVAGIGLIMFLGKKNKKNKDIGAICLGFAILMTGMELMSGSVEGLTENTDFFGSVIIWLDSHYIGIFLGLLCATLFTTVIQSSSASVGVLQALVLGGGFSMSFNVAIPLILGFNIGTCVTAVISSLAANRNAKRVAVTHLAIKIIAVMLCFIPFAICSAVNAGFLTKEVNVWTIAIFHTLFNVVTTGILLPCSKLLEKLAYVLMKDTETEESQVAFIDPILINQSPSVAISECANLTVDMCKISTETLNLAIENLYNYDYAQAQKIITNEGIVDKYEDRLGTYLVQLSSHSLSKGDSIMISKMLHTIGDFERLSDHATNILKVTEELTDKKIVFSQEATKEIEIITKAVLEIIAITTKAFIENSVDIASQVEPLEQVIDGLIAGTKYNHITRLQKGACTIELGFVLSDLLNNYSRVSDHCSNIAVAIIETSHSSFGTHEYLNALKDSENSSFQEKFLSFGKKYSLPTSQNN